MMEDWLFDAAASIALVIEALMVVIIVIGTVHAVWRVGIRVVQREALAPGIREIWLHYAAWILLALEFALAADLIDTVIAPSWEEIRELGAIAAIRIALGYFLGRDIAEIREPDQSTAER